MSDVPAGQDDTAIRDLVARLARPHPSGGRVVERASLLSAGGDFDAVQAWILAQGGTPEFAVVKAPRSGMYGIDRGSTAGSTPRRFILPAAVLE